MDALATHHFSIETDSAVFVVPASNLKPYTILDGSWFAQVLFVSGPIENSEGGFVIVSENVMSQNEKPLFLGAFSAKEHESRKNVTIFNSSLSVLTGHRISHATDKLEFQIRTLSGKLASVTQKLTVGIGLVQYNRL